MTSENEEVWWIRVVFTTHQFHGQQRDGSPEWPPHPERLYEALIAQAYSLDDRGATLKTLKTLFEERGIDEIRCPPGRSATIVRYVPKNENENDQRGDLLRLRPEIERLSAMPSLRTFGAKNVTRIEMEIPEVWFRIQTPEDDLRTIVRPLVESVRYLGRTSSETECSLTDAEPPAGLIRLRQGLQSEGNPYVLLRHPEAGRLLDLQTHREASKERCVVRRAYEQRQCRDERQEEGTLTIVSALRWLRVTGCPLAETDATVLGRSVRECLRNAWKAHYGAEPPASISGKDPAGKPFGGEHLSVLPMPAYSRYRDGWRTPLTWIALASMSEDLEALDDLLEARFAESAQMQRDDATIAYDEEGPAWLRRTATEPARRWLSVRPIWFGTRRKLREAVQAECDKLPRDKRPRAASVCELAVGDVYEDASRRHPVYFGGKYREPLHDDGRRPFVRSVVVEFDKPIRGPLSLGIERHVGRGLLLPIDD